MPFWRANHQYVYYYCQRCGRRQPLSMMVWQNGILVCSPTSCIDTAIVGAYELNVARAVSIWRHELEPDHKLTQPTDRKDDPNDIMF